MHPELFLLVGSAATIAFIHTLLGPDHYLPFVAMAKARGWSTAKTLRITLWCGLGHLLGSVGLGLVGIFFGAQLARLEWIEAVRGETAAWLLIGFGLAYMAWGLRRAWRNKRHSHWHLHDGVAHRHDHSHVGSHAHAHVDALVDVPVEERADGLNPTPEANAVAYGSSGSGEPRATEKPSLTPWIIFIIFVLGPCEPLIPLLMYPAATHSVAGVLWVTAVFGAVTVATMLGAVWVTSVGLGQFRFKRLQRFDHALAGFAIFSCGMAITFLGL